MELKEALQIALDNEQKGHDIYKETSEKTQNPIVKKTFNYLAEQEVNHIDEIKKYMEQGAVELNGDKLADTKQFFTSTVSEFKEKTELSDNDIKAHEVAMEMEQSAYNFYKEQSEKTDNEELKGFFIFLMEQENAHYELIQKALDYIKDPVSFFSEE